MAKRSCASMARSSSTLSTSCSASSSSSGPSMSSRPSSIISSMRPDFIISLPNVSMASWISGTLTRSFIWAITSEEFFMASASRIVAAVLLSSEAVACSVARAVYSLVFALPDRTTVFARIWMFFGSPPSFAIFLISLLIFSSSCSSLRRLRSICLTSLLILDCHSRSISLAFCFCASSVLAEPKRLMPRGIAVPAHAAGCVQLGVLQSVAVSPLP
mmetsp:Transcript_21184/g.41405  ORF Transcript_21184/g.41405 Transcript_21184/m.41405 type:complete len:216 (+) Transcript_21184:265-912(+)